jgi:hypothetical protein
MSALLAATGNNVIQFIHNSTWLLLLGVHKKHKRPNNASAKHRRHDYPKHGFQLPFSLPIGSAGRIHGEILLCFTSFTI